VNPVNPLHPFYTTSKVARKAYEENNAAMLTPLREAFHAYLVTHEGYRTQITPKPGVEYPSSGVQSLWECWLAATLRAREHAQQLYPPPAPASVPHP